MRTPKFTISRAPYRASFPAVRLLQATLLIIAVVGALFDAPLAHAAGVPKILNYQGRLSDENGALLGGAGGTEFCFTFSLWDNATVGNGSKVWPSSNPSTSTVTVANGIFTVGIGDTSIGGNTLDFDFQSYDSVFLNVQVADKVGDTCAPGDGVETYETLSPRQPIRASGYAINTDTVDGFHAAQEASGNQLTALTGGNLILGGTDPFINATTTNALTLQGGGNVSGDIRFFNSTNRITPAGHAIFSGGINAATSSIGNATSTNLHVSNGFSIANLTGPLQAIGGFVSASSTIATVFGGTGQSSYAPGDILYASDANTLTRLGAGANGSVLKVANGVPSWGVSGVVGAWATTSDDLAVYPADPGDVVIIGHDATTTTGNIFEALGNSLFRGAVTAYDTVTAPRFVATSSVASVLPYASSTALTVSGTGYFGVASTTDLTISSVSSGLLKTSNGGAVSAAVAGVDYTTYSLLFPSNATSTLLTFSGGILSTASTTVGSGSQAAGLTVFGGATTTGNLVIQGVGTSTIADDVEVSGTSIFRGLASAFSVFTAPFFSATSSTASALPYASTTAVTVSGTASTSDIIVSNSATIGTLTGPLQAVNGVVSASSTLSVAYGGTGWSAVQSGSVLYGNGSARLATTSAGTSGQVLALSNGVPTWVATTTFGTGLTYADGTVTNAGVTSIAGTANQITASGGTGAVTLSLPALLALTNASSTGISALDYISIGRTATTTIQGGTTGTSTLQGFLNVAGANSTSTFTGGVSAARVNTIATSTLAGTRITSGGLQIASLANCTQALETDTSGNVVCGSDTGVDGVTIATYTSSNTWTKADYAGLTFTQVIVTAGGGGGGGAAGDGNNETAGGGGGSGGTSISMIPEASLGATVVATVGSGGAAGTTAANGGDGVNSSFGTFASSTGGTGGTSDTVADTCTGVGTTGLGGATTTAVGDIRIRGGDGGTTACAVESSNGGNGGASYWGGGGKGFGSNLAESGAGSIGLAFGSGGGGGSNVDTNNAAGVGGPGAAGVIVTMNYTSSGGDLAEWYEAKEDVEHGDVVAVSAESYEYDSKLGLQRSALLEKATSGSSVVGVVSTAPYETIGYDVLGKAVHPRPIALAGRVPVKVSLENGAIKAGDLLTVSSIPGFAMLSTKAGVTIGRAIEDAACSESETCTVLVMVNTSYSTGALTKVALRDSGITMDAIPPDLDLGRIVLAELLQKKKEIIADTALSEINTDRLAAGLEIISPRVITDTLVVNSIEPVEKDIRMRIVDGGRLLIERVNENDLTLTFDGASTTDASLLVSIDALGNALFAGALTANGLEIGSTDRPAGITMYDNDTKLPYCAKVVSGILQTFPGKCGEEGSEPLAMADGANTSIEVPIITIQGNNPARIDIGSTYIDLGAIVTDDKDFNLGIYTFVDGTEVDHVMLDTSTSTEYMVMYRAVDSDGHVSEVIRLVVVGDGLPGTAPTIGIDGTVVLEPEIGDVPEDTIAEATSTEPIASEDPAEPMVQELSPEQTVVIDAEPAPEQSVAIEEAPTETVPPPAAETTPAQPEIIET